MNTNDCLFLSSNASAIFDEETADLILSHRVKPIMTYKLEKFKERMAIFEDFTNDGHKYLMVVDPAFSTRGDRLSITVTNIETKALAGILRLRTGRIEYIADIIEELHMNIARNVPIVVERNNFGKAVIEKLEGKTSILKKLFFYYEEKKGIKNLLRKSEDKIYGINTTKENREKYFNSLTNLVNEKPEVVRSSELAEELLTLEMKNGKIQAMSGCHDDTVLAYAISLYVIEYKYKFLMKFTKTKAEYEVNLARLTILNDSLLSGNSKDLSSTLINEKIFIMNDDRDLTNEMLGDFYDEDGRIPNMKTLDLFKSMN